MNPWAFEVELPPPDSAAPGGSRLGAQVEDEVDFAGAGHSR